MEATLPVQEKEGKPSKINDLIAKVIAEIDRQSNSIDTLEKRAAMILSPPSPMAAKEDEKFDTIDSELATNLRTILDSLTSNTYAIRVISDRIEL